MRFKLTDLEAPPDEVEFADGSVHPVRRVDGFAMDLWRRYRSLPPEERQYAHDLTWELAARLLPTATPEQVKALSWVAIVSVINIAGGNVDKLIADAEGNGRGPEVTAASGPPIPSGPSSSPSPATPAGVPGT